MRHLNAGGRPRDSQLNLRYIMAEVRQSVNQAIKAEYFSILNAGDRAVNSLAIATYRDVAVSNDVVMGRNYCLLPSFYISLPGGVGLQQVRPQSDNPSINKPMIIANPHDIDMISGSLFSMEILKDQVIAEPDRSKIWFSEKNDETLLDSWINTLELKIVVVDPAQVGEDTDLPVDPSQEVTVIREVLALHGYTSKEIHDMINDGNTNSK